MNVPSTERTRFANECVGRLTEELDFLVFYGISKGVNPPRSPKLCMYFKNVCTCNILLLHIRYSFTLFGL